MIRLSSAGETCGLRVWLTPAATTSQRNRFGTQIRCSRLFYFGVIPSCCNSNYHTMVEMEWNLSMLIGWILPTLRKSLWCSLVAFCVKADCCSRSYECRVFVEGCVDVEPRTGRAARYIQDQPSDRVTCQRPWETGSPRLPLPGFRIWPVIEWLLQKSLNFEMVT